MPKNVWIVGFEFKRIERRHNNAKDDDEDTDDRKFNQLDDNTPISFGPKLVIKIFKIKYEEED